MARILLVEDDPDIALALAATLRQSAHETRHAADGPSALREAYRFRPDLVLLDLGLPGLDGWGVLSRIRDLSDVPIVVLTASDGEMDKVRGLRSGADDYLTKPFSSAELTARVDAVLRRTGETGWSDTSDGYPGLQLVHRRRVALVGDREIPLTPLEFRLLGVLIRNVGQVLSPTQLLALVWDDTSGFGSDRVKFTVLRLRRKLGWGDKPLRAVRGAGYVLEPPTDPR